MYRWPFFFCTYFFFPVTPVILPHERDTRHVENDARIFFDDHKPARKFLPVFIYAMLCFAFFSYIFELSLCRFGAPLQVYVVSFHLTPAPPHLQLLCLWWAI